MWKMQKIHEVHSSQTSKIALFPMRRNLQFTSERHSQTVQGAKMPVGWIWTIVLDHGKQGKEFCVLSLLLQPSTVQVSKICLKTNMAIYFLFFCIVETWRRVQDVILAPIQHARIAWIRTESAIVRIANLESSCWIPPPVLNGKLVVTG